MQEDARAAAGRVAAAESARKLREAAETLLEAADQVAPLVDLDSDMTLLAARLTYTVTLEVPVMVFSDETITDVRERALAVSDAEGMGYVARLARKAGIRVLEWKAAATNPAFVRRWDGPETFTPEDASRGCDPLYDNDAAVAEQKAFGTWGEGDQS